MKKGPGGKYSKPCLDPKFHLNLCLWCQRQAPFLFYVYYQLFVLVSIIPKAAINGFLIGGLTLLAWSVVDGEAFGEWAAEWVWHLPKLFYLWASTVYAGLRRNRHQCPKFKCPPCSCPDPDDNWGHSLDHMEKEHQDMSDTGSPPAAPPYDPVFHGDNCSTLIVRGREMWGCKTRHASIIYCTTVPVARIIYCTSVPGRNNLLYLSLVANFGGGCVDGAEATRSENESTS